MRALAALTALAALAVSACGPARAGEPATDAGCDATFGDTPDLAARQAAELCADDPAGHGCDPAGMLQPAAAICHARRLYPKRPWRGGLYYDAVVHRPVYRMFTALVSEDEPVTPHRHLLLDAARGLPLELVRADPARSTLTLQRPDAAPQPLPEYTAQIVFTEEGLLGFDLKIGKHFAEGLKVAARDIAPAPAPGDPLQVQAHLDEQGTPREVELAVTFTLEGSDAHFATLIPLADGGVVEVDVRAPREGDDQHAGY